MSRAEQESGDNAWEEEEQGCAERRWECCCPCFARVMSLKKCLSVLPWYPFLALAAVSTGGAFFLFGLENFVQSLDIEVDTSIILWTQLGLGIVILMDLVFAYSVCSNKLRIHNVHWNAEGCRGYRIKDSENCCSCCLRTCCKFYNFVLQCLNWLVFLIALSVSTLMSFTSCIGLSIVALCEISRPAVDALVVALAAMQDRLDEKTPISNFISVSNSTNSTLICAEGTELTYGSFYMLGGGVVMLVGQVVMLMSYQVVSEVSWRHLKDVRKEGERMDTVLVDPADIHRQRMANSQRMAKPGSGCSVSDGGYGGTSPMNFDQQSAQSDPYRTGLPSFSGFSQPPSFGHNAQSSQNI